MCDLVLKLTQLDMPMLVNFYLKLEGEAEVLDVSFVCNFDILTF